MDRFFYNLNQIILKKRLLYLSFSIVFISMIVYIASGIKLSENVSNILPKSSSNDELGEILENINFNDRIFFNIYLHDSSKTNPDLLIKAAQQIQKELDANCSKSIKEIILQVDNQSINIISQYLLRNLPFLLNESDYQYFDKITEPEAL
ncbi:MAG: hypothetical protein KAH25_03070, partial [Bacteroidales bacterium]|nr:hypothetical protein [Bacteroidales bacterium]